MRRTDRLLALLERLRDGGLHRAADLSRDLAVSQRTLYRDIETLQASGLAIEGTRGQGYRMTAAVSLPPLDLTIAELEALHLGLAVVSEAADPELRAAAASLADKIDAPDDLHSLAIHPISEPGRGFRHMGTFRAAIRARQKLRVISASPNDTSTIRPLGLDYRGRVWTLAAWCEDSSEFRKIRVDRVASVEILPELFVDESGRTLADFHDRSR